MPLLITASENTGVNTTPIKEGFTLLDDSQLASSSYTSASLGYSNYVPANMANLFPSGTVAFQNAGGSTEWTLLLTPAVNQIGSNYLTIFATNSYNQVSSNSFAVVLTPVFVQPVISSPTNGQVITVWPAHPPRYR